MKKVWKSNDGKIFDSRDKCLEYENRGRKLKSNNTLNLGSRNFKRKTNLKKFYKVEEFRLKLREKNGLMDKKESVLTMHKKLSSNFKQSLQRARKDREDELKKAIMMVKQHHMVVDIKKWTRVKNNMVKS